MLSAFGYGYFSCDQAISFADAVYSKTGISFTTPPSIADWCAQIPTPVQYAPSMSLGMGVRFSMMHRTNS